MVIKMIRAKLVVKNVFKKPLRSAIIILSLAAAAFAALFCISGITSAKNSITDFFHSTYGNTDIILLDPLNKLSAEAADLPPGSSIVKKVTAEISITEPNKKYFNYADHLSITIVGIDTKAAYDIRILDDIYPNTKEGVTITQPLAYQAGKKVGDTISFYGDKGKKYDLKILSICPARKVMEMTPTAILVTPELCREISGLDDNTYSFGYVDVVPDELTAQTIEDIQNKYPDCLASGTTSVDIEDAMGGMLNIYYLIFAVVFLMVCFIVVSMSRHIVNERMSVIGMLRSIGGSVAGTGMILMAESAFYGLCGGVLGCLVYLPLKNRLTLSMFMPAGIDDSVKSDGINFLTILLVILGVILIQCLFSLTAIIKASKTPVRDIIFGTKETAYLPSKPLCIIGIIILVAGIVCFVISSDFIIVITAAFLSAIGAALFFPLLLLWISKLLAALFKKTNSPVARLAVREISTTKSSVSSAQLILSAISLTISVLVIGVSLLNLISSPVYDANILIKQPEQKSELYSTVINRLDGVEGVEMMYYKYLTYENRSRLNGMDRDMMVMAYNDGGFNYFTGIRDCPDKLEDNEAAIDKVLASKLSIKVGDEISLTLSPDSYLPTEYKLKVKTLIDASYFNSMGNTVMLNEKNYKRAFFDSPSTVVIKTKPDKVFSVIQMLKLTTSDPDSSIVTVEEDLMELRAQMQSMLTIVYAVVALGFILSLLSTSSNLLMGFEQSRRKYAVYYSSSMSKSKLKKLIFTETLLMIIISVTASMFFSFYFLQIIDKGLEMLDISIPLVNPALYSVLFGALAIAVLLIVTVKPLRMLSRMNIAEEIKTSAD